MRIEQHAVFFKDLVRQVGTGSILPAAFQRPYVWSESDVMALFESILRGYPLGGFLLWSPYGKADIRQVARARLGPIVADLKDTSTSLLLDGQNRLATMAWMGHDFEQPVPSGLSDAEAAIWGGSRRLVLDLEHRRFQFVAREQARQGLTLPAYALVDSLRANPLIRECWDGPWSVYPEAQRDDALRWFDTCTRAFSDARVVVTDVQGATAEEAKDAFLHICRVGVPMAEKDLEAALGWQAAA